MASLDLPNNRSFKIISAPNILAFPKGITVILEEEQMNEIRKMKCFQDYVFYPPPNGMYILDAIREFVEVFIAEKASIGVVIPEKNPEHFIETLF